MVRPYKGSLKNAIKKQASIRKERTLTLGATTTQSTKAVRAEVARKIDELLSFGLSNQELSEAIKGAKRNRAGFRWVGGHEGAFPLRFSRNPSSSLTSSTAKRRPSKQNTEAIEQNIEAGRQALARARGAFVEPGVQLNLDQKTPKYRVDPNHPDILIRELNGKIETISASDYYTEA